MQAPVRVPASQFAQSVERSADIRRSGVPTRAPASLALGTFTPSRYIDT